jgi:ubiquinone/menaquinone biosynthesis C-methylase UbiE
MVVAARRRNAAAVKAGRVDLRYGDAADLPFDDAAFDKAFSIHSLYFWPHPLAALKEVWRVLKPGGLLVMTILPKERWNADDPDAVARTPECRPYSGAELAQMMAEASFSVPRIEQDSHPAHASSYSVIGVKVCEV